jgi:ferredoxin
MLNIDRSKVEIPYETNFWGQKCECDPRFVEEALGDGESLIGIQPLSTRPHFYVIRIDSKWHLSGCRVCADACPDELTEHLDEVFEAIEDEYSSVFYAEDNGSDGLEDGAEPQSPGWPAFNDDCGVSWFSINPRSYLAQESTATN